MIRQLIRLSFPTLLLALISVAGMGVSCGLSAQELPWLEKGKARLDFAPTFWSWDARYGLDPGGAARVETLGSDLTADALGNQALPDLRDLEASLAAAMGEDSYLVRLGVSQAVIDKSRLVMPLRLEVGVTDWMVMGVMVPFSRPRTEMVFGLTTGGEATNVGLSPQTTAPGDVTFFVNTFQTALDAAQETHPGDASVVEAQAFLESLTAAYAHETFFPALGSTASNALQARMAGIQESLGALGISGLPDFVPVAGSYLTSEEFGDFLEGSVMKAAPLENFTTLWSMGDIEITTAFRVLHGGFEPDSMGELSHIRYQVGAGLLLRLGTGTPANFNRLFEADPADGQTDVEGSLFGLVEVGRRFGGWGSLKYGVQNKGKVIKRIAAPGEVLPLWKRGAPLYRTPGNYLEVDLSPRYFLTPTMTFGLRYHLWSKGADSYELQPLDPEVLALVNFPPTELLNQETEQTLNELGVSMTYSTLEAHARGETSMPLYLRATYFHPMGGSGGQTPKGGRFEAGLTIYRTIWGRKAQEETNPDPLGR